MARAYLYYTGYYGEEHPACTKAEAVAAINDVVDYGGYELESSYADFWMPACTTDASSGDTYAWKTTYAGKWYDGSTWQAGQGNLSKEIVLNLKMNSTSDYNGNGDGNTFSVYLGPRNRCMHCQRLGRLLGDARLCGAIFQRPAFQCLRMELQ